MVHEFVGAFVVVIVAAVTVSALSRNANTAAVLGATFGGVSAVTQAITAPVSGSQQQAA